MRGWILEHYGDRRRPRGCLLSPVTTGSGQLSASNCRHSQVSLYKKRQRRLSYEEENSLPYSLSGRALSPVIHVARAHRMPAGEIAQVRPVKLPSVQFLDCRIRIGKRAVRNAEEVEHAVEIAPFGRTAHTDIAVVGQ